MGTATKPVHLRPADTISDINTLHGLYGEYTQSQIHQIPQLQQCKLTHTQERFVYNYGQFNIDYPTQGVAIHITKPPLSDATKDPPPSKRYQMY